MALNDRYRLELRSQYLGQQFLNVFHYLHTAAGTGDAAVLGGRFLNVVLPAIRDVSHTSWSAISVSTYNLDDPVDFNITTTSVAGVRTGDPCSQFTTWSYTFLRGRTDMRSGGKRFGGVSETDVSGGLPSGGILSLLTVLEAALETPLAAGASDLWRVRILGKRYDTLGQFMNPISAVNLLGTYTMNSRKNYTAPGF